MNGEVVVMGAHPPVDGLINEYHRLREGTDVFGTHTVTGAYTPWTNSTEGT